MKRHFRKDYNNNIVYALLYVDCQNVPLDKWNTRCQRGSERADFRTEPYLNHRINRPPLCIFDRKRIVTKVYNTIRLTCVEVGPRIMYHNCSFILIGIHILLPIFSFLIFQISSFPKYKCSPPKNNLTDEFSII